MQEEVATTNLLLAALMRQFGATIVRIEPGRDGGTVVLDVTRVTSIRIQDEMQVLASQMASLVDRPCLADIEDVVDNTCLGLMFREYAVLKRRVLTRRPRSRP